MTEPLSKIPRGMRYYYGAEARLRRAVEDAVMSVFDGWSYEEITPPSVDYYALFERGMGHEESRRAFRFTDTDGRLLALRPDVTSSVARAAATLFAERPRPLRLCYAAAVFRQQPPTTAAYGRESKQLGCEFIGAGGRGADLEVLAIAVEILERLGLRAECCITLNSVEVFNGVAEGLGLDAGARERMRHLMDVRDAADLESFLSGYTTSVDERERFSRLTQLSGKRAILEEARSIITNARSAAALDTLERTWRVIERLGLSESFAVDLGDVGGLDYYTGLTFKIYVAGAGSRVGGGGRYDRLTANFGRAEPAVGFVLDLDALTEVMLRRGPEDAQGRAEKAGVESLTGDDAAELLLEARRRRASGERVTLNVEEEG